VQDQLFQFLGSLAAILLLAGLAWWLKLGPERRLSSEEEARRAAAEAADGFEAKDLALDAEGRAALLRDVQGRIMLLRPHGTHFAARILTPAATARIESDTLIVDTSERRYGSATLRIAEPQAWVKRIEAIK